MIAIIYFLVMQVWPNHSISDSNHINISNSNHINSYFSPPLSSTKSMVALSKSMVDVIPTGYQAHKGRHDTYNALNISSPCYVIVRCLKEETHFSKKNFIRVYRKIQFLAFKLLSKSENNLFHAFGYE